LFHDRTAAVAAYGQADIALSQVEDAAFSTVRQSIAAEIAALNDTHVADAAVLTMQLAGLRAQASLWPTSARALSAPAPPPESRLARVLGAFVQVRHNDAAQTRAALHAPNLARELFLIDLREAEAATLARDETRYRAALEAARTELPVAFDVQVPAVAAAANELDGLARAALAPPAPPLLGAALKELRNLRATHALREAQPAARAAGERK
jgi:uroporphyrin-3 C-methyltransferase